MKKRFEEEQIIRILREADVSGVQVWEVCRRHDITEQTFFRWRKKYGGLEASEAQELKQLREENRRLKGLVADLTLDKQILQEVLSKKV